MILLTLTWIYYQICSSSFTVSNRWLGTSESFPSQISSCMFAISLKLTFSSSFENAFEIDVIYGYAYDTILRDRWMKIASTKHSIRRVNTPPINVFIFVSLSKCNLIALGLAMQSFDFINFLNVFISFSFKLFV